jgi:hypothetical protein
MIDSLFDCEAYGPEPRKAGAECFISGELHKRVCGSQNECRQVVDAERKRIFRRINELAAAEDQNMAYLAEVFSAPDQLFPGSQDDDQQQEEGSDGA